MSSLNKVLIRRRIGLASDVRHTAAGNAVATPSLAQSRAWNDSHGADTAAAHETVGEQA